MSRRFVLHIMLSAGVIASLVQPGATPIYGYGYWFLRSDLVVRATLTDVRLETVPIQDLVPADPRAGVEQVVVVLDIEVHEVLKGYFPGANLSVVVPTDLRGNYVTGAEMVLPLIYWKTMKGGSFILTNEAGRFVRIGDRWLGQAAPVTLRDLKEIRLSAREGSPETLFAEANAVVVGTIAKIEQYKGDGGTLLARVALRVSANVKGGEKDSIDFRIVEKDGDELPWKTHAPTFKVGEEWLVFLAKDSDGYFLLDGTAGVYRIEGDDLMQAGRLRLEGASQGIQTLVTGGDPRVEHE